MNILVTGGAGFIGANFLAWAVPAFPEHRFVNLDALTYAGNLRSLAHIQNAANYRFTRVDITDRDAVAETFEEHAPDLVLHFAAESHVDRSIAGPLPFVRTNVEGTLNLLEASRAAPNASDIVFHHVSTDEVYGSLGATGLFHETTAYDPSSPYSASKAASDHFVRAYHRTYGLATKITNCSNNYGPRQFPEKLIPLMILKALAGEPLPIYGDGLNVRDWLYVQDHCEAIWAVATRGQIGRTYNIGGSAEQTNVDVVDSICHALANATGADVDALLALKTFVRDRPGHDRRYAIDASRIHDELGWEPKETFDTGLSKTVRWYLDHPEWIESVQTGAYREWMAEQYEEGR